MTIHEIKNRTQQTSPYFFSRESMKFFGQTLRDFKVRKQSDGKYLITAPSYWDGKLMGITKRLFNPETNKLEFVREEL